MKRLLRLLPLVGVLGSAPLMVACATPADQPDVESRVTDQLKSANPDNKVNADWKADEKALHLTGEVKTAAEKARAEEIAQKVVGTSGRVVNEVKLAAVDMGEVDDRIEEQLGKMFEDRTEWDFDGKGVTFDSNQGVVTITGNVESEAVKSKIGARARAAAGVTDVVNNLEVETKKTAPGNRRRQ